MTLHRPLVSLAAVCALLQSVRAYNSLPDDVYAYPKYSIGFLNGLPLPNVTAQYWLAHGLKGGEKEFLEQAWDRDSHGTSRPQITGGETINSDGPVDSRPALHRLEHMRLGPGKEYLCLIPPPDQGRAPYEDAAPPPSHPSKTWSLLQPLSGKCLYHRQGWFTYSYCHNERVRQFREMTHGHPHPIQGRIPEEDTEWEAYNLGVSPAVKQKGGNDVSRQAEAAAANLELQRAADQRYLVQRWGDGTQCDKTGRGRQIEIQFHCSMSSVDQIVFVKEVSVCNYLIVIHTPRICSEPGFKSQRDSIKAAPVRCREIVSRETVDTDRSKHQLESAVPIAFPSARPVLPPAPPAPAADDTQTQDKEKKAKGKGKLSAEGDEFVQVALNALFGAHAHDHALAGKKVRIEVDGGIHEIDFKDFGLDAELGADRDVGGLQSYLADVLKQAGYDVRTDEWPEEKDEKKGKKGVVEQEREEVNHQEL